MNASSRIALGGRSTSLGYLASVQLMHLVGQLMKYDLYAGNGEWLLVPDCLMPPHAAELKFGQLRPICRFDEALIDSDDLKTPDLHPAAEMYEKQRKHAVITCLVACTIR